MSDYLALALLAIVQGLTEFLPISSSGHLGLAELMLGVGEASLSEDIVLHLGTLVAVILFYRRELASLLRGFFARGAEGDSARRYVGLLVLATLPAAVIGLLLKERIEAVFAQPIFILLAFVATGILLWRTRGRALPAERGELLERPPLRAALWMGCAQALAILPGLSRSGWTVATGLFCGVPGVVAARFSFLLSIPAILGAAILTLPELGGAGVSVAALGLGFLLSALVGLFALAWLVRLLRSMAIYRFAPYLWSLALLGFVVLWWRG
jgi:undecaprenyl-diphosphatase